MRKLFAGLVISALSSNILFATVIHPSLPAGTQYQLVFATAGELVPSSTSIGYYNAFVTAEAALSASLPVTTWHAVASTASINANANAPSGGLPVYNTQGILVATAATGLYTNPLSSPIQYDQFGNVNFAAAATGSTSAGFNDGGGVLGSEFPTLGEPSSVGRDWASAGTGLYLPTFAEFPYALYALSDPITAVPEPATYTLLVAALMTMGGLRLMRRTCSSRNLAAPVLSSPR